MIRYSTNVAQPAARREPMFPEASTTEPQGDPGSPDPKLADDLLRGADAIANFVFGSPEQRRKVYYYATDAKFRMPVFRIGAIICARKSTLMQWIERQESMQ